MQELIHNQQLDEIILTLQDCDKTMSKDGKDGKDDVSSLAHGCQFGKTIMI